MLFHSKETFSKAKRQPIEWEKIFVNDMTDKSLISKIYKQLIQPNIKKNKQTWLLKWAKDLNRHFLPKKTNNWATGIWKKCSISLIIREMQIPQWNITSHLPESKSLQITNVGENVEKREPSYSAGRNVNL